MTKQETKEYHLKKLYELSITSLGEIPQLEDPTWDQEQWVKSRMIAPAWTWQRWDGMIEEWTPWSRSGEWINQFRY